MSERTKGPWEWDGDDLWHFGDDYEGEGVSDPHRYTGIRKDGRLHGSTILAANARLLAAAPTMYDAMRQIVHALEIDDANELACGIQNADAVVKMVEGEL